MTERQLTVSRVYPQTSVTSAGWRSMEDIRVRAPVPFLRLTGRWLAQAGFDIGDRVRVEVAQGRLVLTLDEG